MSRIVHDWPDDRVAALLAKVSVDWLAAGYHFVIEVVRSNIAE